MSIAVDVAAEGMRLPLARARVADLVRGVLRAERVRNALVSVAFLDDRAMARLNREHLGHRGSTDVISFGFAPAPGGPVVGDVYIAPAVVRANARAHGTGVREELARVVIHGTLHVLGHDHPTDEGRTSSAMWRRQEQLLRRLTGAGLA
jgi:probable rRNA maturation factor